jgi:hypothetical protein
MKLALESWRCKEGAHQKTFKFPFVRVLGIFHFIPSASRRFFYLGCKLSHIIY